MVLKLLVYYSITIFCLTAIVAFFSKRKAVLIASAIFMVFFAFFNFFSTSLVLFFLHLQNLMVSIYDTIFDKIRLLSESGGTNVIKRLGVFFVALFMAIVMIKNTPFIWVGPRIVMNLFTIPPRLVAVINRQDRQNINLIYERYNC